MKNLNQYIIDQLKEELSYDFKEINESGGLYKGQLELSSFLCDDFENKLNSTKDNEFELSYEGDKLDFDNIFFDELKIIYHLSNRSNIIGESSFMYYDDSSKLKEFNYNEVSKRLYLITIDIYIGRNFNNDIYDKLRGRICHELNHCYTYYDIIKDDIKEDENNQINIPKEYNHILHKYYNKAYSKIIKDVENPKDKFKRIASLLIYTLTRYERNAFLAEIDSYIFSKGSKLKNLDNLEDILKKCNQYNIYKDENFRIIDIIKSDWNNDQKQILVDLYNDIYKTNKSFKRIIYLLSEKNKQTLDKLNRNIKKLIIEYKDLKEGQVNFEGSLSYFKSPMSDYLEWF